MYAYGILENVVYKVKAVVGYALTVIGILSDVFMDKQYGSISHLRKCHFTHQELYHGDSPSIQSSGSLRRLGVIDRP